MANFDKLKSYYGINETETEKVNSIVASILNNGWVGAPILFVNEVGLVTGSHRLAALKKLDEMCDDVDNEMLTKILNILDSEIALDVSDIVNEYCDENDCTFNNLPFDSLSQLFKGTWVEQYKGEIAEW